MKIDISKVPSIVDLLKVLTHMQEQIALIEAITPEGCILEVRDMRPMAAKPVDVANGGDPIPSRKSTPTFEITREELLSIYQQRADDCVVTLRREYFIDLKRPTDDLVGGKVVLDPPNSNEEGKTQ